MSFAYGGNEGFFGMVVYLTVLRYIGSEMGYGRMFLRHLF